MQKYFLTVLSVVLTACSQLPERAKIVQSMDANQYLGTWYEIARLDNRFERGLEQVTAQYSKNADGTLKVINRGFNIDKKVWKVATGKAYFVDPANRDGTNTGKLKVSFFGPFYGGYNIIALDKPYYNYAMVASGNDYLWILARTPQLAYPIKQHLISQAKEAGFATNELIFVKQNNQVEFEAGRHVLP